METGFWVSFFIVLALLIDFVIRVLAIIIVPRNRKPTSATAWLLAIFLIPYIGILFFLLIGSYKLPKSRRQKQDEINRFIIDSTEGIERVRRDHPWPPWLEGVVELNRKLGAMPLVGGNRATLNGDYQGSLDAMAEEIGKAKRYVHVEFYILTLDKTTAPFFDALEAAVERGVTVRVLLDHIASLRTPDYKRTLERLTAMGARWQLMLPVQPFKGKYQRPDLRNHRKLLVVDGRVAFMGSQNVIDRSYNKKSNIRRGLKWKELIVRLEGPIVAGLNAIFITDWYSETDELLRRETEPITDEIEANELDAQVVPSGPGFAGENNLQTSSSHSCTTPRNASSSRPRTSCRTSRCSWLSPRPCSVGSASTCSSPRSVTRPSSITLSAPTTKRSCAQGSGSGCTRRPTSFMRSTSPSTTTSPSSVRATWTCVPSSSTWRSPSWCAGVRSWMRCGGSRTAIARTAASSRWTSG